MSRSVECVCLAVLTAGHVFLPSPVRAQAVASLGGIWTLNRSLTQSPPEIRFNPDFVLSARDQGAGWNGAGRARRGAGMGGSRGSASPVFPPPESAEDVQRLQFLTAEVRKSSRAVDDRR